MDHSKFDSTVNSEHLKQLHSVYRRICGKGIQKILKYQLNNVGWTKTGIKYTAKATRMSGDFDTALGNTLINVACILKVFKGIRFDFMLDGDDAIIVMEQTAKHRLKIKNFEYFGFETKLAFTTDIAQVEFCQSRLVYAHGWTFVRNPIRAIMNQTACLKGYNMKGMARWLAGVGLGELSVSSGVPILQQQGYRLSRMSDNPYFDPDEVWRMAELGNRPKPSLVSDRARDSMSKAWGIPPDMQVAIEHMLPPMMLAYILKRVEYDFESLYESWTRLATMGCSCFAGSWLVGGSCL